jgi:hypothetical protein
MIWEELQGVAGVQELQNIRVTLFQRVQRRVIDSGNG